MAAKATAFAKALETTSSTKKKSTARKKGMPILDNAPKDVKESVDAYVESKRLMKEAKADMDFNADIIIDYAEDERDKDGFNGNFSKSYAIHGNGEEVKFVTSNRYSLNADDEEVLATLLADKFDELIESDFSVELKPEVLENEELQAELMELIGDKFAMFFTTRKTLRVADDFDRKIYLLSEKKVKNIRAFVKQYKPSLR